MVSVSSKQEVEVRGSSDFLQLYPCQGQVKAPRHAWRRGMGWGTWGGGCSEGTGDEPWQDWDLRPQMWSLVILCGCAVVAAKVGLGTQMDFPLVRGRREAPRREQKEVVRHAGPATAP